MRNARASHERRHRRRRPARPDRGVPPGAGRRARDGLRARGDLGGLAGSVDLDGHRVDRYYHVVLPTDDRVRGLAAELGLGDDGSASATPGVGFCHAGRLTSMSSAEGAADVPAACRPVDRVRLGAFVARCQLRSDYDELEQTPLEDWLRRTCGKSLWDAPLAPAARLEVRRSRTTTCRPRTCGRARAACRARATQRRARSWARSMAATSGWSTARGARSARAAARSTCDAGALRAVARTAARSASCSTPASGRTTGSSRRSCARTCRTCWRPTWRDALGPDPSATSASCAWLRASRKSVSPYYALNITDRAVPLTTVVETTHVVDPETRRRHAALRPEVRRPGLARARRLDAPTSASDYLAQAAADLPVVRPGATCIAAQVARARVAEPVHVLGGERGPDLSSPRPGSPSRPPRTSTRSWSTARPSSASPSASSRACSSALADAGLPGATRHEHGRDRSARARRPRVSVPAARSRLPPTSRRWPPAVRCCCLACRHVAARWGDPAQRHRLRLLAAARVAGRAAALRRLRVLLRPARAAAARRRLRGHRRRRSGPADRARARARAARDRRAHLRAGAQLHRRPWRRPLVAAALAATVAFDADEQLLVLAHTIAAPLAIGARARRRCCALARWRAHADGRRRLVAAGPVSGSPPSPAPTSAPRSCSRSRLARVAALGAPHDRRAAACAAPRLIALPAVAVPLAGYGALADRRSPAATCCSRTSTPVDQLAGRSTPRSAPRAPLTVVELRRARRPHLRLRGGLRRGLCSPVLRPRSPAPERGRRRVGSARRRSAIAAVALLAREPRSSGALTARPLRLGSRRRRGVALAALVLARYRRAAARRRPEPRSTCSATFLTLLVASAAGLRACSRPYADRLSAKPPYVMPFAALLPRVAARRGARPRAARRSHARPRHRLRRLPRRGGNRPRGASDARGETRDRPGRRRHAARRPRRAPPPSRARSTRHQRPHAPRRPVLLGPQLTGLYIIVRAYRPAAAPCRCCPARCRRPRRRDTKRSRALATCGSPSLDRTPFTEYGHGAFGYRLRPRARPLAALELHAAR